MKYENEILNRFFRKPAVEILIFIYNNPTSAYKQKISKNIDVTYSYVVILIKKLCSDGILKTEKVGRIKIINLTEKGKELAKLLHQTKILINQKSTTL